MSSLLMSVTYHVKGHVFRRVAPRVKCQLCNQIVTGPCDEHGATALVTAEATTWLIDDVAVTRDEFMAALSAADAK